MYEYDNKQAWLKLQEKTIVWIFVIETMIRDLLLRIWKKLCKINLFCVWLLIVFFTYNYWDRFFLGPFQKQR